MFAKNILFERFSKMWPVRRFKKCNLLVKMSKIFKKKNGDNSLLFACSVCCETLPSKNFIHCNFDHHICKKCISQFAKTYIYSLSYETIIKGFPCSHFGCQEYLSYETCSKFLPKKIQSQIQLKINEAMLIKAGIQYEKCRKCDFMAEKFDDKIFNCPNCSFKFCYNCNKKCWCSHNYEKCVSTMQKQNDNLSEALIHRCHECNVPFIKIDGPSEGCNQMDCKCGASQCYACREPINVLIGGHHCSGRDLKAQQIHERDVENAKVIQFLKMIF